MASPDVPTWPDSQLHEGSLSLAQPLPPSSLYTQVPFFLLGFACVTLYKALPELEDKQEQLATHRTIRPLDPGAPYRGNMCTGLPSTLATRPCQPSQHLMSRPITVLCCRQYMILISACLENETTNGVCEAMSLSVNSIYLQSSEFPAQRGGELFKIFD